MDIGALLESCNFSVFWKLIRGEYVPSASTDEKFKNPDDVKKLLQPITGFEDAVRHCESFPSSASLVRRLLRDQRHLPNDRTGPTEATSRRHFR